MRRRYSLISLALFLASICQAVPATLTPDEAKNHIGENATVCGIVAGTHYAENTHGSPTFVNLGAPYPKQPFTILIWGEDLSKFNPKPSTWEGKRVCATGTITSYQGRPEIVAKEAARVTVEEAKAK
jgi:hypothetical protein